MVYFHHLPERVITRPLEQLDRTDGHYYRHTQTNRIYPSITTVLRIETQKGIEAWKKYEPNWERISKESTEAGTAMHELIEDFLNNKPLREFDKTKFAKDPYKLFETIKYALADIDNIYAQEMKIYSDELGVAGTTDCIAEYEGVLSVIDFKNSRKPKPKSRAKNYFLQACAYSKMAKQCLNLDINQGVILIANWDDTVTTFKFPLKDFETDLWKVLIKWETQDLYT